MNSFPIFVALLVASIGCVASQNLLVIGDEGDDLVPFKEQELPLPTRRPYSPLRPAQLPPFFQNLGITLPPPPPPPIFIQEVPIHFLVELGQPQRFFGLLQQLKPSFLSWFGKPITSPTPSNDGTTERTERSTTPTKPPTTQTTEALQTASTVQVTNLPQEPVQ